mmetsp:Transcript_1445/g.4182  ORF Transcript_1445/g.4182 Transcript_1445/m.4182 type:complete len:87 (-) Transcript_1445:2819-3079(-)
MARLSTTLLCTACLYGGQMSKDHMTQPMQLLPTDVQDTTRILSKTIDPVGLLSKDATSMDCGGHPRLLTGHGSQLAAANLHYKWLE